MEIEFVVFVLQMAALLFGVERAHSAKTSEEATRRHQEKVADSLAKMADLAQHQTERLEVNARKQDALGWFESRLRELEKLNLLVRDANATGVPPTGAELSAAWAIGRRLYSDDAVHELSASLWTWAAKWSETSQSFDAKGDRDVFFATAFALQNACLKEMAPFIMERPPTSSPSPPTAAP